jgi:hypothetical protein
LCGLLPLIRRSPDAVEEKIGFLWLHPSLRQIPVMPVEAYQIIDRSWVIMYPGWPPAGPIRKQCPQPLQSIVAPSILPMRRQLTH